MQDVDALSLILCKLLGEAPLEAEVLLSAWQAFALVSKTFLAAARCTLVSPSLEHTTLSDGAVAWLRAARLHGLVLPWGASAEAQAALLRHPAFLARSGPVLERLEGVRAEALPDLADLPRLNHLALVAGQPYQRGTPSPARLHFAELLHHLELPHLVLPPHPQPPLPPLPMPPFAPHPFEELQALLGAADPEAAAPGPLAPPAGAGPAAGAVVPGAPAAAAAGGEAANIAAVGPAEPGGAFLAAGGAMPAANGFDEEPPGLMEESSDSDSEGSWMSEDEDGEWADLPPLVLPPLGDLPPLLDDGPPGLIADDEIDLFEPAEAHGLNALLGAPLLPPVPPAARAPVFAPFSAAAHLASPPCGLTSLSLRGYTSVDLRGVPATLRELRLEAEWQLTLVALPEGLRLQRAELAASQTVAIDWSALCAAVTGALAISAPLLLLNNCTLPPGAPGASGEVELSAAIAAGFVAGRLADARLDVRNLSVGLGQPEVPQWHEQPRVTGVALARRLQRQHYRALGTFFPPRHLGDGDLRPGFALRAEVVVLCRHGAADTLSNSGSTAMEAARGRSVAFSFPLQNDHRAFLAEEPRLIRLSLAGVPTQHVHTVLSDPAFLAAHAKTLRQLEGIDLDYLGADEGLLRPLLGVTSLRATTCGPALRLGVLPPRLHSLHVEADHRRLHAQLACVALPEGPAQHVHGLRELTLVGFKQLSLAHLPPGVTKLTLQPAKGVRYSSGQQRVLHPIHLPEMARAGAAGDLHLEILLAPEDCRSLSLLQLLALRPSSVRLRCRSLKVFCSSTHMIGAVMGPALLCVMEQLEASPLRRLELEVDEVEFTARDVTGTLRVAFTSAGMQDHIRKQWGTGWWVAPLPGRRAVPPVGKAQRREGFLLQRRG